MFLDTEFPPDSRVENEAHSLIEDGHEVFIFSVTYKSRPVFDEHGDIAVTRFQGNKLLYKSSAVAYQIPYFHSRLRSAIMDFITSNKIEALHVHDLPIAGAVFKVNRQHNLPITLDLHENRPEIMQHYRHMKQFPGKYVISISKWKQAEKSLIDRADKVVVVTEEARDHYCDNYGSNPDRFIVVPNTIHPEIFLKYPLDEKIQERFDNGFNLLYLGDTSLRRGTADLIKAVKEVSQDISDIRLIIVGTSSEHSILETLVADLALQEHVFLEGWQDVSLFPSYIHASSVCLSPLERNIHHDTTFANKIFQYMAMGKPLIVSDCPAQEKVVKDTGSGIVYEAGNLRALSEAIKKLWSNHALREELGQNGKEAVLTKWNWEETSKDLIAYYRGIEKA